MSLVLSDSGDRKMLVLLFLFLLFDISLTACPNGTVTVPSGFGGNWNCVSFISSRMSFVMAEDQCVQLGGHLVSIPNGFVDLFIAR